MSMWSGSRRVIGLAFKGGFWGEEGLDARSPGGVGEGQSGGVGTRDERDDDSSVISFQIQVIFVITPSVHHCCRTSGFGLGLDIVLSLGAHQHKTTKYVLCKSPRACPTQSSTKVCRFFLPVVPLY
jgi:hypothetical protein